LTASKVRELLAPDLSMRDSTAVALSGVPKEHLILSRVRDSVTDNNGFWIGEFDLLALLLQLHLITITYNSAHSMTVWEPPTFQAPANHSLENMSIA
jgi:hypothetical protein